MPKKYLESLIAAWTFRLNTCSMSDTIVCDASNNYSTVNTSSSSNSSYTSNTSNNFDSMNNTNASDLILVIILLRSKKIEVPSP